MKAFAIAFALLAIPAAAADIAGVPKVIDGDTLELAGARIRLHGIDAPERGEPGFESATTALLNLVAGREIVCHDTGSRTHRRVVATCTVARGGDLAALMVGRGWAAACPRFTRAYLQLEAAAREGRLGIWGRGGRYERKSYCEEP